MQAIDEIRATFKGLTKKTDRNCVMKLLEKKTMTYRGLLWNGNPNAGDITFNLITLITWKLNEK